MTTAEHVGWIDGKILRHLAIKAGRSTGYFTAVSMPGLRRATWTDDEEFLRERLDHLVATGKIQRATRTLNEEIVEGVVCLPGKIRNIQSKPAASELQLTPYDLRFLSNCGIAAP